MVRQPTAALDLVAQGAGVFFGPNSEFASKHLCADLVLLEGQSALALGLVKPHQATMGLLLQWVEAQETLSNFKGAAALAALNQVVQQSEMEASCQTGQTFAFIEQPVFACRIARGHAFQKLAAVKRDRLFQGSKIARVGQTLEDRDVALGDPRIQGHQIFFSAQRCGFASVQGPTQGPKCLPEARAGLILATVAPEEPDEFLPAASHGALPLPIWPTATVSYGPGW